MKMDFKEFQSVAGDGPKLPGSEGDEPNGDESPDDDNTTSRRPPNPTGPTVDMEIGPDGPTMGLTGPIDSDDTLEVAETIMEMQQQYSQPDLTEQFLELATNPKAQKAAKELWFGPENVEEPAPTPTHAESTTTDPTPELDTGERTAETDGGTEELAEDNIYEITPEGLVAILQQQVGEVAALKPEMSLEELDSFMEANEERLIGEARELLDAMDGGE